MNRKLIEIGISSLIALVFAVWGIPAILSQHYEATIKNVGLVNVDGILAVYYGLGWLGMGLVLSGVAIWRMWPEQKSLAMVWVGISAAISGIGWILSQTS